MRVRLIAFLVLVVGVVPAVSLAAGSATTKLEATFSGKTEVPKAGNGKGTADITITGAKVCWEFKVSGIDTPLAAHIHKGGAGKAGPVVVPLGAKYTAKGCTTATAALAKAIAAQPAAYYVNVHTKKYPAGAVRGQLKKQTY